MVPYRALLPGKHFLTIVMLQIYDELTDRDSFEPRLNYIRAVYGTKMNGMQCSLI